MVPQIAFWDLNRVPRWDMMLQSGYTTQSKQNDDEVNLEQKGPARELLASHQSQSIILKYEIDEQSFPLLD
tara:strand:+ start:59502 stop:59714 length:213 start_codon:yes stop_codon:yes gene_type:complete